MAQGTVGAVQLSTCWPSPGGERGRHALGCPASMGVAQQLKCFLSIEGSLEFVI